MSKTSKECYTDVFEGIRLTVCGAFGLVSNAVEGVYDGFKKLSSKRTAKRKEKIVDAEYVENEESNG